MVKNCSNHKDFRDRYAINYVVAYDFNTGQLEPLSTKPIDAIVKTNTHTLTWNSVYQRGLVAVGTFICESLLWVTPEGPEFATITINEGGREWRLDQEFHDQSRDDCDSYGLAESPAWSPDGRTIAFFATLEAMGISGQARMQVPLNLYLMDPVELKPRKVLENMRAGGIVWSPDSRWLAFTGKIASGQEGIWIYNPATQALRHVSDKNIDWLDWSPDGKRIIGAMDQTNYPELGHYSLTPTPIIWRGELWLFDVSEMVL